jgi:chromosome segregation ATPase
MAKRKCESDAVALQTDLDEIMNDYKNAEDKAKKAMVDAARLADEVHAEQEHSMKQDNLRKSCEAAIKDLKVRLEEAETAALRGGQKMIEKLDMKCRQLESSLENEQRRHSEAAKNARRGERRARELTFQAEEDKKNQERQQQMVEKLQQKITIYKRQIEEAEEIAAMNMAKFRKAQQGHDDAEERVNLADQTVAKLRARSRGMSVTR